MFRLVSILALFFAAKLFVACTSGKTAYNQGKYYEASIKAIQRLREIPNHKKAKQVLAISYPLAIENLEFDAKNAVETNSNMRYRTLLQNYHKINGLYNEIKKSPGALQVIPHPINKYNELAEVKQHAAKEAYNAGIQALLKDTREDAKKAYFLFGEANSLSPGFKESIEMAKQAKLNATLKVLVEAEAVDATSNDWNFESAIFSTKRNEFVQFYAPKQLENQIKKVDQVIRIVDKRFSKGLASVARSNSSFSDSVKVGEKEVKGKKYPQYQHVKATLTTFNKKITGKGEIRLIIVDQERNAEILNTEIVGQRIWSASWGRYTGDSRALSSYAKQLCKKKELYMPRYYLYREVKKNLDSKLKNKLASFYRNY